MLDLRRPIYKQTAGIWPFSEENDLDLPWEKLDKVDELKKIFVKYSENGTNRGLTPLQRGQAPIGMNFLTTCRIVLKGAANEA